MLSASDSNLQSLYHLAHLLYNWVFNSRQGIFHVLSTLCYVQNIVNRIICKVKYTFMKLDENYKDDVDLIIICSNYTIAS